MNSVRSRLAPLGSSQAAILAIVCLSVFSTALDQTVVLAALPTVMLDLKLSLSELDTAAWIVTGYLIGYTVVMPLAGRLSDIHGRVRVFQAALLTFAIGSAFVAVAPNFGWIVAARVVQAIGGGATLPIGLAMAMAVVAPRKRGMALGLVAASAEAGAVLGPIYGGALIEWVGWRLIFWLDIPQSLLLIAVLAILRNHATPGARMDYAGTALLGATLTVVTIGLSQRAIFSLDSAFPYIMLALGAALAIAFVFIERRSAHPLIAPFLYRSRAFVSANMTQLMAGMSLIIALVGVPLMANTIMEKGDWESALHLARLMVAIPVGAAVGGYILRWTPARPIVITGLVLIGIGLLFMSGWERDVDELRLTAPLLMAGLGFGLILPPISVTALSAAPSDYWGTAASLVTAARMVGMAMGLAALSAWGIERFYSLTAGMSIGPSLDEAGEALIGAGVSVFQDLFMIAGLISLLAILPALFMRMEAVTADS